jgi:predicted nucleic acid-binding protein
VYLVDTSVWVEVFRKHSRFPLHNYCTIEEIVTCLPVIQEVLQGFRDESAFRIASEAMRAFPIAESPLRPIIFDHAVDLYRQARRAGLTIRSGVDCLIAACAIRNGLSILHRDRDFSLISTISPLRSKSIAGK